MHFLIALQVFLEQFKKLIATATHLENRWTLLSKKRNWNKLDGQLIKGEAEASSAGLSQPYHNKPGRVSRCY